MYFAIGLLNNVGLKIVNDSKIEKKKMWNKQIKEKGVNARQIHKLLISIPLFLNFFLHLLVP